MIDTKRILFLCTGNYYRSRYAEELFNHLAPLHGVAWRAFSRALAEGPGPENVGPISQLALDALRAGNVEATEVARLPISCCEADLTAADLIIGMKESEHRPLARDRFPGWENRIEFWHIDDIEIAPATVALPLIDAKVHELIAGLSTKSE